MIKTIFSVKGVFEDKERTKDLTTMAIEVLARELAEQMAVTIRRKVLTEDEVEKIALDEMRRVEEKFQKMSDKDVDEFINSKVEVLMKELFED